MILSFSTKCDIWSMEKQNQNGKYFNEIVKFQEYSSHISYSLVNFSYKRVSTSYTNICVSFNITKSK